MNSVRELEICPFCGKMVIGDPWKVKGHVRNRHENREKDFTLHLKAMIKHWLKY